MNYPGKSEFDMRARSGVQERRFFRVDTPEHELWVTALTEVDEISVIFVHLNIL